MTSPRIVVVHPADRFLNKYATSRLPRLFVWVAAYLLIIGYFYFHSSQETLACGTNGSSCLQSHRGKHEDYSVGTITTVWDDESVRREFESAIHKIKQAEVIHEPFDHISVHGLFSGEFYEALMKELPPHSAYDERAYAGTSPQYAAVHLDNELGGHKKLHIPESCGKDKDAGCWKEVVSLHGRESSMGRILTVETNMSSYPLWNQAIRLVHSKNFTVTLYDKFATDTGIPKYKREEIKQRAEAEGKDSASTLRNSAALRIEPTSYHLTPHIDMFQKVVTWQFFHPENFDLQNRQVGTRFYTLKPPFQNNIVMNDAANPKWLDYSHFDVVKEQPVIPNYFFAFAPNNHSWHGASIDPEQMVGVDPFSRRTFLGVSYMTLAHTQILFAVVSNCFFSICYFYAAQFITTQFWGFHHFHRNDWAKTDYFF